MRDIILDKIKVYKRSDASEVKLYKIAYSETKIYLEIYENNFLEVCKPLFLTKSDPLGKFTKEMDGFWFCKEYVVIIANSDLYRTVWHSTMSDPHDMSLRKLKKYMGNAFFTTDWVDPKTGKTHPSHTIDYSIGEDKYLEILKHVF